MTEVTDLPIMRPRSQWEFEWIDEWSTVFGAAFLNEWSGLLATASNSPFYHPAVVKAWLKVHGGLHKFQPFFLHARCDGVSQAIWPLVRPITSWKQGYVRELRPVGHWLFDYHDPIHCKLGGLGETFWEQLSSELVSRGASLCDSFDVPRIRRSAAGRGTDVWSTTDVAPFVRLDKYSSIDEYMASRKSSLRVDVRRQIKRLSAEGEVSFRVYDGNSISDVQEWIPNLESSRKERYPGSSLPPGYLNSLVTHGLPEKIVHCSAVELAGKPISWHIGFSWQGVLYWYVPLYEARLANYSPGKIHLYFALEWAMAHSFHTFDFLRGLETYKSGWTDGEEFETTAFHYDSRELISRGRRILSRIGNQLGYCRRWFPRRS